MELLSNAPIPGSLPASMTLLSEKPRLGVRGRKSAPNQRIDQRNCTAVLGLRFRCSETVSGTVVAPNNNKQQQQDCLNEYNNSAGGKAVQFLSLYNLATNLGSLKTWAEWTALPYLKIQAVNLVNNAAQAVGNTEFLSITSGGSTTILSPTAAGISAVESAGAVAGPIAIGAATVTDIQVHAACAGNTPQVELAPTVF